MDERPGTDPGATASDGPEPGTTDGTGTTEATGVAAPRDAWATFDRWSSNLFLVVAVVGLLVILIIGGQAPNMDALLVATGLAIAVTSSVLLLVTSVGLDRKRGWARATAFGVLLITLVSGLVGAVSDFTRGTLTIPLGTIIAALVLTRKPGPLPAMSAHDRRVAAGLLVLYLAASLGGAPAWLLTQEASPIVADRDQLDLAVTSDCPVGGAAPAGATTRVNVTVTWHWRSRDLLPLGSDAVELSWGNATSVRLLYEGVQTPAGATRDGDGSAIQLLAKDAGTPDLVTGFFGFTDSITYSLEAGGQVAGDGRLLAPFDVDLSDGGAALDLVARFAHAGAWTTVTEASCVLQPATAGAAP